MMSQSLYKDFRVLRALIHDWFSDALNAMVVTSLRAFVVQYEVSAVVFQVSLRC